MSLSSDPLLTELLWFVDPVLGAAEDAEGFAQFIACFGYDLGDLTDLNDDLPALREGLSTALQTVADQDPDDRDVTVLVQGVALAARAAIAVDVLAGPDGVLDDLPGFVGEVVGWLAHVYITSRIPLLAAALDALGVVGTEEIEATDPTGRDLDFVAVVWRWDRLTTFLTDTAAWAHEVYGWGTAADGSPGDDFDAAAAIDKVAMLLEVTGLVAASDRHLDDDEADAFLTNRGDAPVREVAVPFDQGETVQEVDGEVSVSTYEAGVTLLPYGDLAHPADLGLALAPYTTGETGATRALTDRLRLAFTVEGSGTGGAFVTLTPGGVEVIAGAGGAAAAFGFTFSYEDEAPIVLAGSADATRLQIDGAEASVGGGTDGSLQVAVALTGVLAALDVSEEGLLGAIVAGPIELPMDALRLVWDTASGVTFDGGSALAARVPLDLRLGPLHIREALVRLDWTDDVSVALTVGAGLQLGPVHAVVDGIGLRVALVEQADGIFGDRGLSFGFVPPTGLGLAIDAGPVTGGGFIRREPATGRYEGSLQLKLGTIGLSAIGLLETGLPDDADGYSLLVVIRAEFPPIALPFGFVLTSVGGLLGLHRRIDVDELRSRFASGAAGRILAPEDPIGNAPALLSELGAVFPAAEGRFVVGPTLQLGWTAIVRFDLGLFFELPGLSKVVLLGSARATIDNPAGAPLLHLRLDVIGLLAPAKQTVEFDAVLIDSQLLEVFELTGGAAFRLNWGSTPHVVLSIGGFHPRYDPAPLSFPSSLTRVAMTRGRRQDAFYLRFEGYLAVTNNSLQLGAAVEMILRAGGFVAEGSFAFDVLIRFLPFRFEFDLRASLRVAYGRRTLAGVKVVGSLSGPGPIEFSGTLTFEILFLEISWSGSFAFGSPDAPTIEPVANAAAALLPELGDPRNLSVLGGDDGNVIIEPDDHEVDVQILPPAGRLVWAQSRAPLELLLERFGGAPLVTPATLRVDGPHVVGGHLDWFAPAMSVDLDEAEQLDRDAFEELDAGVIIGVDEAIVPQGQTLAVTFSEYRIPEIDTGPITAWRLPVWLQDAADGRIPAHHRPTPAVTMTPPRYAAHASGTGQRTFPLPGAQGPAGTSAAQAHQQVRHGDTTAAVILVGDLIDVGEL